MDRHDLHLILVRAAQAPHGLVLRVSDIERARNAFARARQAVLDADLPPLEFRRVDLEDGNLLITRTHTPQAETGVE